jgi:hypothetical protein
MHSAAQSEPQMSTWDAWLVKGKMKICGACSFWGLVHVIVALMVPRHPMNQAMTSQGWKQPTEGTNQELPLFPRASVGSCFWLV